MQVLRHNGQKVLEGDIWEVRIKDNGDAALTVLTHAKSTLYSVILTPADIDEMKLLFHTKTNSIL